MNNLFCRVRFGEEIQEVPAHWEVDREPFANLGPTCLAGNIVSMNAKRKLVPDEMSGIRFRRVIGAEGYEFEAIDTRKAMHAEAKRKCDEARAARDFETAIYWAGIMRKYA